MPAAWTRVDATTATFTVTLVAASCTTVTPVAPTVTQAVCRRRGVDGADGDVADDDGITYTRCPAAPPAYAPGQVVTVTATLTAQGVGWPAQASMPAGWTSTSPTTATFTVDVR